MCLANAKRSGWVARRPGQSNLDNNARPSLPFDHRVRWQAPPPGWRSTTTHTVREQAAATWWATSSTAITAKIERMFEAREQARTIARESREPAARTRTRRARLPTHGPTHPKAPHRVAYISERSSRRFFHCPGWPYMRACTAHRACRRTANRRAKRTAMRTIVPPDSGAKRE